MKSLLPILAVVIALGVWSSSPVTATEATSADDELDRLLQRLVRVASLYRDSALEFDCEESIAYTVYGVGKHAKKFAYLFVYDDEEGFLDYRLTRRQVRKERALEGADPEDYGITLFLERAYLFTLVFHEKRIPFYRYSVEGEEEVLGRQAIRLLVEPIPPMQEELNDWFGWFWIDRETSQILRVHAYQGEAAVSWTALQRDLELAQQIEEEIRRVHVIHEVTVEFGIEKNGMRFPSRGEIEVSEYVVWGGSREPSHTSRKLALTTQVYSNYRFFRIKTAKEIYAFVEGNDD